MASALEDRWENLLAAEGMPAELRPIPRAPFGGPAHIPELDPCENAELWGTWQLTREYYENFERAAADESFVKALTPNQQRMLAVYVMGTHNGVCELAGNGASRWLRRRVRKWAERSDEG